MRQIERPVGPVVVADFRIGESSSEKLACGWNEDGKFVFGDELIDSLLKKRMEEEVGWDFVRGLIPIEERTIGQGNERGAEIRMILKGEDFEGKGRGGEAGQKLQQVNGLWREVSRLLLVCFLGRRLFSCRHFTVRAQ